MDMEVIQDFVISCKEYVRFGLLEFKAFRKELKSTPIHSYYYPSMIESHKYNVAKTWQHRNIFLNGKKLLAILKKRNIYATQLSPEQFDKEMLIFKPLESNLKYLNKLRNHPDKETIEMRRLVYFVSVNILFQGFIINALKELYPEKNFPTSFSKLPGIKGSSTFLWNPEKIEILLDKILGDDANPSPPIVQI